MGRWPTSGWNVCYAFVIVRRHTECLCTCWIGSAPLGMRRHRGCEYGALVVFRYSKAAEQGIVDAQSNLGVCLSKGKVPYNMFTRIDTDCRYGLLRYGWFCVTQRLCGRVCPRTGRLLSTGSARPPSQGISWHSSTLRTAMGMAKVWPRMMPPVSIGRARTQP